MRPAGKKSIDCASRVEIINECISVCDIMQASLLLKLILMVSVLN